MQIIVDGVIYGFQKHGGINTMFNSVLPRLAHIDKVTVKLLLPRRVLGEVPELPVRKICSEAIPERTGLSWKVDKWLVGPTARQLNKALREFRLGRNQQPIFLSTYFTWPDIRVPQLAIAYDINHELFPDLYQGQWGVWLRQQYREYLQRATRIVAISEKTKKDIVHFYDIAAERIDVVHLAVESEMFFHERDATENATIVPRHWIGNYLLYVGLRSHYKNFPMVLEAIARIPNDLCAGLVVAGKPWKSAELEMIHSLGIEDRVLLVAEPSICQLRRLYSFSLAFVFPSLHEGFGIPLLEAMACQTPVLAADTEVFREIAGDAAFFFPPNAPDELVKIVEYLKCENHRDRLMESGTNRLSKFTWTQCAQGVYDACLRSLHDWESRL